MRFLIGQKSNKNDKENYQEKSVFSIALNDYSYRESKVEMCVGAVVVFIVDLLLLRLSLLHCFPFNFYSSTKHFTTTMKQEGKNIGEGVLWKRFFLSWFERVSIKKRKCNYT